MELYRVSLEWKDVCACEEWERRMAEHHRRSVGGYFNEAPPARKTHAAYVAVRPGFGGSPLGRAANLACEAVIGGREHWPPYEVVVLAVEHVGSVTIEQADPDGAVLAPDKTERED